MWLASEFESQNEGIVRPEYEMTYHVDVDIPKVGGRK